MAIYHIQYNLFYFKENTYILFQEVLRKTKRSAPSYPLMRVLRFPERFSMILNGSDSQVSAEFVSAVDEVVFEEFYMFIKLLDESGKTIFMRKLFLNKIHRMKKKKNYSYRMDGEV